MGKGGLHSHQGLGRRRILDRSPGLRAQPQHGEAGVHGGGGSPAGPSGRPGDVIRVQGHPGHRAPGPGAIAGEVREVGLTQDDGSRFPEPLHGGGIIIGDHIDASCGGAETRVAHGGDQAAVVQVVLDDHRHPVKGSPRSIGGVLLVQLRGDGQRVGIHGDECVIVILVDGNVVQKGLGQFHCGVASGGIVRLDLLGGELHHIQCRGSFLSGGMGRRAAGQEDDEEDGS